MSALKKVMIVFVMILSAACSNKETTVNIESPEDYQGRILEYEYLDRDNLIMLTLSDESKVLIDAEGNVKPLDTKLNSDYFRWSDKSLAHCNLANYSGNDYEMYDIYGNVRSEMFLEKDASYIRVVKCDNGDVIWHINQEDSYLIFTAFDENGKELMNFNSQENPFIQEKTINSLTNEIEIPYIVYGGNSVFTFTNSFVNNVTDLLPENVLFSVNIDTQKLINSNAIYSEGYGITYLGFSEQVGIFDSNGNFITDREPERIMSNGLYYEADEDAFYDSSFNLAIDLEKYNKSIYDSNGNVLYGPDTVLGADYCFVFQGNYCPVSFRGEDSNYFSIIDRDGNLLFQPISENEIGENPFRYIKEIDSNHLLIDDMIFDLSNRSLKKLDSKIYQLVNNSGYYYAPIEGKIYYLEYGELKYYDPNTDESKVLGV